MGMIIAFNALIQCMVTGLFTALFIMLFQKLGWMPMFLVEVLPQSEEEVDETEID